MIESLFNEEINDIYKHLYRKRWKNLIKLHFFRLKRYNNPETLKRKDMIGARSSYLHKNSDDLSSIISSDYIDEDSDFSEKELDTPLFRPKKKKASPKKPKSPFRKSLLRGKGITSFSEYEESITNAPKVKITRAKTLQRNHEDRLEITRTKTRLKFSEEAPESHERKETESCEESAFMYNSNFFNNMKFEPGENMFLHSLFYYKNILWMDKDNENHLFETFEPELDLEQLHRQQTIRQHSFYEIDRFLLGPSEEISYTNEEGSYSGQHPSYDLRSNQSFNKSEHQEENKEKQPPPQCPPPSILSRVKSKIRGVGSLVKFMKPSAKEKSKFTKINKENTLIKETNKNFKIYFGEEAEDFIKDNTEWSQSEDALAHPLDDKFSSSSSCFNDEIQLEGPRSPPTRKSSTFKNFLVPFIKKKMKEGQFSMTFPLKK
ncbi:unnamed protein product [Moneuplotes crassus]|uniref:Uncharacterized protein n=1 Tax=Euplotes crassus TaxID=5936 RepID=A0AAD2D8E3_EUPCR|nr:unnamed protein product [Moneuplotes crassus]